MSRQRRRKSQQDGTLKGKCEVRFLKNCYAPIGYISIVTNDCYHRTLTATARVGTGSHIIHKILLEKKFEKVLVEMGGHEEERL